jgi:hypothetical protein
MESVKCSIVSSPIIGNYFPTAHTQCDCGGEETAHRVQVLWVFCGNVSDDSELLGCDVVSLGEWLSVFHTKHKRLWQTQLFLIHHGQSIFRHGTIIIIFNSLSSQFVDDCQKVIYLSTNSLSFFHYKPPSCHYCLSTGCRHHWLD